MRLRSGNCRHRFVLFILLTPLWVSLAAASLFAQAGANGAISGFVTDPSGAAIAGVAVKVTNVNTGVSYSAGTTTDGYYTVKFLIPGTYRVAVAQPGFKTQVVNDVVVQTDSNPTVNIKLTLGAVTQTVTVKAANTMLALQTADTGSTIDTVRVDDLPTQQRNAFQVVLTGVGVLPTTDWEESMTLEDNSKSSSQSINGSYDSVTGSTTGQSETNEVLIDGVDDRGNYAEGLGNSTVGYLPSQEAVGEVQVVTNPYSAEYGNTLGGAEIFTTKSGTSRFHGEAFEYNRSFGLSANSFSNNLEHVGKSPLLVNTPGGNLGGPIKKGKLYFFGSMEYMDEHSPTVGEGFGMVPTSAERSGDFSADTYNNNGVATPITLYNPFSCTSATVVCTSRSVIGSVGDSVIPSSLMSPIATSLWKYIPLPDVPGNAVTGANNYYFDTSAVALAHTYEIMGRVDYNINDKNRIFLRATREDWHTIDPPFYGNTGGDAAEVAGDFPAGRTNNNDVINYTHIFSPTMVLNVLAGFEDYFNEDITQPTRCSVTPAQLGFSSTFASQAVACIPVFGFTGAEGSGSDNGSTVFTGAGEPGSTLAPDQVNTLSAMLMKSMGRHTLKFGAEGLLERGYLIEPGDNSGAFSFSSQYSQQNPSGPLTAAQGDPVASFEMGVGAASIQVESEPARQDLSAAWFVQDDIKVSHKLTINAGLRWDWDGTPTDRFNAITGPFNETTTSPLASAAASAATASGVTCPACANLVGGLTFPGVNGVSRSPYGSVYHDWGPRLGAAYAITPNTVIRAGWGLFYLDNVYDPGSAGFSSTTSSTLFSPTYQVLNPIANPFPTGLIPATGSALGLSTDLGNTVTFVDPHTEPPQAQQFNFNVQHQFPHNFLLLVGYNYNLGTRMAVNNNINSLSLAQIQEGYTYLNTPVANPFAGLIPNTSLNTATIPQKQLLLPYPQFTTVTEEDMPIGTSSFQALEINVTKHMGNGLSFSASYTNSRHEDLGAYMNTFNTQLMKEDDPYDIPQAVSLNGVYELPMGRGKPFASSVPGWANKIIGGWQLNWNILYMSGNPWQFSNITAPVAGVNPNYSPQTLQQWVNPAAFQNSTNTPFCFPEGSSNCIQEWSTVDGHVRNPGTALYDLGVHKSFKITERVTFTFMNNWINATNTPQWFGNDSTSCEAITASCFGKISGFTSPDNLPREIQMAGKITF